MKNQRSYSPIEKDRNSRSSSAVVGLFGLITIMTFLGIFVLALYRAGYIPGFSPSITTPTTAGSNQYRDCENLINQAMLISGDNCDHLGPNQVCYGNIAVQADLIPDASQNFAKIGDTVDIQKVQRLSTAPLDLVKKEWGIAVLNIMANLPRSLPGESVKMVIFGNTTIGNNHVQDIQSFYFYSELGKIICNRVPFDGVMITMPNGTGINLTINGSVLTLMGNASLRAEKNKAMDISLYSGTASVTSNNQTQYLGAGQSVQVSLGGTTGLESVSVPSQPTSLSIQELNLACTLSGINCSSATQVPTINPQDAQATMGVPIISSSGSTPITINGTPQPTSPPSSGEIVTPQGPQATQVENTSVPETTKKTPPGHATPPGLRDTPAPDQPDTGNNGNGNGGNNQPP